MKKKKSRVINANYPPPDLPEHELERIWGSPDDIEPIKTRKIRVKRKKRDAPKPSPV